MAETDGAETDRPETDGAGTDGPETDDETFTLDTPSDREITVTRLFDAPRAFVFDAFTRPEIAKRWFYGPDDWPLVECAIDLKVGGALRFVWAQRGTGPTGTDSARCGLAGVYREVVSPGRTVHTELFDEDWTGGETVVTTRFEDRGDRTTVAVTVRYASQAARDAALATAMIDGWRQMYDRFDGLARAPTTAGP